MIAEHAKSAGENPVIRPYLLDLTVFICGAVVMIYEIIGSRIVSPFIGASTYVWTSLIGVILGALSLGYWLGGRLADRRPDTRVMASIIFAAGGLIGVTVLIKDVLLSFIAAAPTLIEVKALIAALLLFAPASICLGVVTPFAVRLKLDDLGKTGATAGRLYAVSTVGSILGTFGAGFLLIPFIGSVRTLYGLAIVLVVLGALLAPLSVTRVKVAAVLFVVFGIAATEIESYAQWRNSGLYDIDTEYARVRVFNTTDIQTGRPITALATDPYFAQSAIFADSDELVFDYTRYPHLLRHFKPDFSKVLMIGGAGFSVPKEFLRTYPNVQIDVVEIDPGMTAIARRFFRLKDDPRLAITHTDGRMFLNQSPAKQYDGLFMDVAGSMFTIPYQLTTIEAVQNVSRVLKPDGVAIFNLGTSIEGPGSRFLQAELATYRSVFPAIYVFKVNSQYPDERLQNVIILASKSSSPAELDSDDPLLSDLLAHVYSQPIGSERVLTDDLAPVEYYSSIAQNYYLRSRQ